MRAPRRTALGTSSKSRHSGLGIQLALILLVVLAAGVVAGAGSWAAFTDTTVNPSSNFTAGSVDIDDNDGGTAMLSIANGTPGSSDTGCIPVSYAGSLPANVRLYGSTSVRASISTSTSSSRAERSRRARSTRARALWPTPSTT
jgi:predicted ribosomally synthesized peptide with SipW-like signal peptide